MTSPGYLRYPHLHGDLLAFTAEDDVWIARLTGGATTDRAWRVSCDRTRVSHPRFSPDGRTLAWTSWLSLTPEVWTAPTTGGETQRLSYWGSQDTRVRGWLPDGEVLAVTSFHEPFGHYTWAHALPPDGSPGRRMPWGPVGDAQMSRDRTVLLTGGAPHEPAAWKRYRGGATGRLWVDGLQILPDHRGHLASPMPVDGRIAFLSDHEGIGNLYSCRPDGTDLRRHTDHASYYAREAATDGTRIVYQHAGDLWLLESLDAPAPHRLHVPLGGARAGRRPYQVGAANQVKDLACDHTGRTGVITVRGSQYWLTHKDGPARALADTPGVRTRLPVVLGHTGEAAWITDAEGADAVEVMPLPGHDGSLEFTSGERHHHRVLAAGRLGRVLELTASPDGTRLAAATSDGRLLLVATADGEVREVAASGYGPVSSARFSPDSHWIAWSQPAAGRSLRRIRLTRADAPAPITEVTDGRFEDEQPVFTRDGRYLAFLSWRGFDPVHDVHTGDLSFPVGCRPYLVPLTADTPSPFAAPAEDGGPRGDSGDGTVRVDPQGIGERLLQFPVIASKYSAADAVRGGLVWLRWPISGALGQTFMSPEDTSGRPSLEYFDLARGTRTTLVDKLDGYAVSGDGGSIAVYSAGTLRIVPVGAPSAGIPVDLRRISHTVRPAAEWRQAYHEAARIVRDQFWDDRMSGLDWPALVDQYEPLLDRIAGPDDFADLLRELLGELGTSHAYVTPSRRGEGPSLAQQPLGLLGATVHRNPDGRWLFGRVLPGETSDPRARAPLAAQGVKAGDELLEIGGHPVDPVRGPLPLLAGTGGNTVEIGLRSAPDTPVRRITVTPVTEERPLRYQDWVTKRRALVREFSDGRCGYLHIPDLGGSGWAQFNRDLRRELDKPALVLDVRGNAGGNVSELVLEKLTRRVLAWDFTRDRQPVRWPRNAPRGPVVALADEATSSDGDVIIAAIELLGLGPVVGTRTWGGVVGMTGRHTLGDGTQISVPKNASWFTGGLGWSVENHGVEPDVHVLRGPRDWASGRHPELRTAVRLALELLEDVPAAAPPPADTPRPDLRRPPLPPRGSSGNG